MRLSTAIEEIAPLRDPRVKANPAYATIIILSRVITQLGALSEISPAMVENFFIQILQMSFKLKSLQIRFVIFEVLYCQKKKVKKLIIFLITFINFTINPILFPPSKTASIINFLINLLFYLRL
jgi:hypothetical protein